MSKNVRLKRLRYQKPDNRLMIKKTKPKRFQVNDGKYRSRTDEISDMQCRNVLTAYKFPISKLCSNVFERIVENIGVEPMTS
jgi:hypothetical protein